MNKKALLLVGHGSSFNRESSEPVYRHAAWIQGQQLFDEVHVAFWKEPPWICDSLALIESEEIYVVPMFLAEGYFTRVVVPRELGSSRPVHLCPPVGAHPWMPDLVLKRAASAGAPRHRTNLIVIGHGTDRSHTSAATVQRVTRKLRERSGFRDVRCGFLDQEPRIEKVVAEADAPQLVLVPFFMADGWHVRESIPKSLGLSGERTVCNNRTIWYTRSVGTLSEIASIVVDLAIRVDAQRTPLYVQFDG